MNAQSLIDQYNQAIQEEETAKQTRKAEAIQSAQDIFIENCRVWLGTLWEEFQPGDVTLYESKHWDNIAVNFSRRVSFMGIPGEIKQRIELQKDKWFDGKLDFGTLHFEDTHKAANIDLDMDKEGKPVEVNPMRIGYLLSWLEKYAPIYAANQKRGDENRIAQLMDFDHRTLEGIHSRLEQGIKEFPALADQFKARADEAIRSEEARVKERQAEYQRAQEIEQEIESLRNKADIAWQHPFTLYLITYGAYLEGGEEGDFYTKSFYALEENSGNDGYYRALENGRPSRLIRPNHVLSTEKVTIAGIGDAPYEAKRYIELTSKDVPDARAYVYLPPAEVFAFDIETVTP